MKSFRLSYAVAAALMLASVPAFSQFDSTVGASDVTLSATVTETLTVTLDNSTVNFTLTPGSATNAGNNTVTPTTAWLLGTGRSSVSLYAYFDDPTSALSNGTMKIPTSAFSVKNGSNAAQPFTGVNPFSSGAGVTIFTTAITDVNRTGSSAPTLNLNIDLSSVPVLGAGTYTGTLHFRAEAIT
jgi:hypothetical protein